MARPIRAEVTLRENESFERLLKRFLKKVKKEEIIEMYNERRFYEKPSVTRTKKKKWKLFVSRKRRAETDLTD